MFSIMTSFLHSISGQLSYPVSSHYPVHSLIFCCLPPLLVQPRQCLKKFLICCLSVVHCCSSLYTETEVQENSFQTKPVEHWIVIQNSSSWNTDAECVYSWYVTDIFRNICFVLSHFLSILPPPPLRPEYHNSILLEKYPSTRPFV